MQWTIIDKQKATFKHIKALMCSDWNQ